MHELESSTGVDPSRSRPDEQTNLWDDPSVQEKKDELPHRILRWWIDRERTNRRVKEFRLTGTRP